MWSHEDEVPGKKVSLLDVIKDDAERDVLTIKKFINTVDVGFKFYKYMIKSLQQIFKDGIEKLKFALVLPYLIEEQCELEEYLSNDLLNKINTLCEKSYLMKLIEKHELDNIAPGIQTVSLDFHIIEAIEILQNNKNITANIEKYLEKVTNIGSRILNVINIIEQVAATRFWVAVLSVEANEMTAVPKAVEAEKSRKFTSQLLAMQEMEEHVKKQIQVKTDIVQQYQFDLISQKKQLNYKKNKAAINASTQIEDICNKNETGRYKLEEEIAEMKLNFERFQAANIVADKKLRERKKRFLIQLQAWIKKYEDDVTTKVKDNYKIDENIEEVQKELDTFMIEFKVQEVKYYHLWNMKQAEKELALRKRIKSYEKHRAARTLQRYWRLFLDKKKKKRGKKK